MPSLPRPLALRGDAFTSPTRTPWGGTRLVKHFGKRVPAGRDLHIGESWELSLGPELPSTTERGERLWDVIERDPSAWLGSTGTASAGLLVKLLDADEPLSLQIHPSDEHPGLAIDESGKPEAWYVVHSEPGSWIAFGWRDGVGRDDVLRALAAADGSLAELLQRVPVTPGDCFVVDAGTPHAIGRGVTLVEPQEVVPGKRGVTYRYWDWDRRYDADGRLDPAGHPRALAVDDALAVTDWERATGRALLAEKRLCAGAPETSQSLALETLASASGPLRSEHLRIERLVGSGSLAWPSLDGLSALTVIGGLGALVTTDGASVALSPGRTVAVPARHDALVLEGDHLHAVRSSIERTPRPRTSERA